MSGGVISASIQLNAAEARVKVHPAGDDLPGLWFLTLSTIGGHVCIGGTLEELRQLAGRIDTLTAEVGGK